MGHIDMPHSVMVWEVRMDNMGKIGEGVGLYFHVSTILSTYSIRYNSISHSYRLDCIRDIRQGLYIYPLLLF